MYADRPLHSSAARLRRGARSRRLRAGFTLTELMVVLGIMGMLSLGVYLFTLDSYRALFISSEKLQINRDVRTFTGEMIQYAKSASEFYIYPDFETANRNEAADRQSDSFTGDFLFLVNTRRWPGPTDDEVYTGYVGYFRKDEGSGSGPVYRIKEEFDSSAYIPVGSVEPEALITNLSPSGDYKEVIELSKGLANGRLFYNFRGNSIMIKAEILHGNDAKRITDTYNFTVSPQNKM